MDIPKIKDIENYIINLDIDSALKHLETLRINKNLSLEK